MIGRYGKLLWHQDKDLQMVQERMGGLQRGRDLKEGLDRGLLEGEDPLKERKKEEGLQWKGIGKGVPHQEKTEGLDNKNKDIGRSL